MNKSTVAETTKELLADTTKRIKLEDYAVSLLRGLLDATNDKAFPAQGPTGQAHFVERVEKYGSIIEDLQTVVTLIAKWGDADHLRVLDALLVRLAEAEKPMAGSTLWLRLGWYPLGILLYSAGIAALANKRYDVLKIVLETSARSEGRRSGRLPISVLTVSNLSDIHDAFKWLPGHERKHVPRSEHLYGRLQQQLDGLVYLGNSYDTVFDDFEILLALAYIHATDGDWGPIGRFGWKHRHGDSPLTQLLEEATKAGASWGPLRAGMFNGSTAAFEKAAKQLQANTNSLSWF